MNFIQFFEYILGITYSSASSEEQLIILGASAIAAVSFTVLLMWGLFLFVKGLAHGK